MIEENDPDVTAGMTDEEMDYRFRKAVRLANEEKIAKGVPLPMYDFETRKAYLLYPDGKKVYTLAT
jgi:hypothetical protein